MVSLFSGLKRAIVSTVLSLCLIISVGGAATAQSEAAKAFIEEGYVALRRGDKVEMNEAFAKACAADAESRGCINAGQNFKTGYGVPKNVPRAVGLFDRACKAGVDKGCSELAMLRLETGTSMEEQLQSFDVMKSSCNFTRYDDRECLGLGRAYETGQGTVANPAEAARIYEKVCDWGNACDSADALGCFESGRTYLYGIGVAKDLSKAALRLQYACDIKIAGACELAAPIQPAPAPKPQTVAEVSVAAAPKYRPKPQSNLPPASATFAEHQSALRQLTPLTSVGTSVCNELIRRLRPSEGKSQGEWGERWWLMLQASYRSNNQACNTVPVAFANTIQAEQAAAAPTYTPPAAPSTSSNPNWCDSTCQRQKTIRDNRPLNCYVQDGRRICN